MQTVKFNDVNIVNNQQQTGGKHGTCTSLHSLEMCKRRRNWWSEQESMYIHQPELISVRNLHFFESFPLVSTFSLLPLIPQKTCLPSLTIGFCGQWKRFSFPGEQRPNDSTVDVGIYRPWLGINGNTTV